MTTAVAHSDSKSIYGQVVHATGTGLDGKAPNAAHNIKVQVYTQGFFGDRFLGEARTDDHGRFSIDYSKLGNGYSDLTLKIKDRPWHLRDRFLPWHRERTIRELNLKDVNTGYALDCGKLKIDFWEYQQGWPRLAMPADEDKAPQASSTAYKLERLRAGFDEILAQRVIVPIVKNCSTMDEVQELFGKNLTMKQEEKAPGSTRTGEWTAARILNGFNPAHLRKGEGTDTYRVEYNWDTFVFDNTHYLPNAKVKIERVGSKLSVTEVSLQYRQHQPGKDSLPPVGEGSTVGEWKTYRTGDADFEEALKEFRIAYMVAGETDMHLGAGHLNVEQYAVAAFRNLHDTPLANLLFPFLREVVLINHEGNGIIFGDTGVIPGISALTPAGVEKRLKEEIGGLNWKDYSPRSPLSNDHHFAHIANRYWDILGEFVDDFFENNNDGIRGSWHAVRKFSHDLVSHAYPYRPAQDAEHDVWADTNEIGTPDAPRQVIDGVLRAVSPVAKSAQPNAEEMQNLKEVCRYAIFMASFWHSWCNDHQPDDGGEIAYAALGRRDDKVAEIEDASRQLFLVHVLAESKHGLILDNENGDIPQGFLNRMRAALPFFAAHEYDGELMRSMINI